MPTVTLSNHELHRNDVLGIHGPEIAHHKGPVESWVRNRAPKAEDLEALLQNLGGGGVASVRSRQLYLWCSRSGPIWTAVRL